jgi:tRNA (mo5U34)-methyltransferase
MTRQWMHTLELPTGTVVGRRPLDDLRAVADLVLPADMSGLDVLDIGPADGYFSFESERRGARRVVALDFAEPGRFGLLEAKAALRSGVECHFGNVYDLTPAAHGTFDIVLFMGVFYHLRYPLLAFDRIAPVCRDYMAFETLFLPDEPNDRAVYQFYRLDYEGAPGDYTVWFSPNARAIEDGLISAGFEPRPIVSHGNRTLYTAKRTSAEPEYRRLLTHEARYIKE